MWHLRFSLPIVQWIAILKLPKLRHLEKQNITGQFLCLQGRLLRQRNLVQPLLHNLCDLRWRWVGPLPDVQILRLALQLHHQNLPMQGRVLSLWGQLHRLRCELRDL